MNIIRSLSEDKQEDIIKNILDLHNNGEDIELDPTYSKGVFYKNGVINEPKYKFDLSPKTKDTIQSSSDNLPLDDESVQSIMFDPPFIIAGKTYKNNKEGSSKIAKRFSAYENFEDLKSHYKNSLEEFYRITKKNGILIFKCQNTVSSGKQHFTHFFILKEALRIGWYPKDEFVLKATSKMTSFGGRWKTQRHAMKHHSYFLVFQKKNCNVNYE